MIIEDESNNLVVKGNTFIEGRYLLSLTAHKLLLTLISKVDPTKKKLPEFNISEKELVALDIGVSDKTVRRNFTDACLELLGLRLNRFEKDAETGELDEIAINVFTKTNKRWTDSTRTRLKEVRFTFSSEIAPYLSNFEEEIRYTKYLHKYVKKLPTSPAIRMYELLRRWRNMDERKHVISRTVELESLKYMIGLPHGKQKTFANFKKNILEPCRVAISEKTDLLFEFDDIKANKSRKVTHIRFRIYSNDYSGDKPTLVKPENYDEAIANRITTLVPTAKEQEELIYWYFSKFTLDILKEALADMSFEILSGKDIKSPARYLKKVCENKAQEVPSSQPRSMVEKLTDRSWADGWLSEFED